MVRALVIKKIRTIGDKWATFQTLNFENNSQPFYVLLDTDMNLLNKMICLYSILY